MNFGRTIAGATLVLVLSVFRLTAEESAQPLLDALRGTTISGYIDEGAQWNPGTGNSRPTPLIAYGTEILLQHQDGRLGKWLLFETNLLESSLVVPSSTIPGPRTAIASDRGSIFFEQFGHFVKDNSFIKVSPAIPMKDLAFAGTANMVGSSDGDLVWASRWQILIWEIEGARVTRQHIINGPFYVTPNAKVVGIGHFDENGSLDFLWRDPQGFIWVTLMEGRTVRGTVSLNNGSPINLKWSLRGTGDFNSDGRTDLLWQHEDKRIATWFMNGTVRVDAKLLAGGRPVGVGWKLVDAKTVFFITYQPANASNLPHHLLPSGTISVRTVGTIIRPVITLPAEPLPPDLFTDQLATYSCDNEFTNPRNHESLSH